MMAWTAETKSHLLIVENEPHIRAPLSRALQLLGFQVTEASCGQETLELLRWQSCDLLIIDIQLPDVKAKDLLRQIFTHHRDLPVIILTGHTTLDGGIARFRNNIAGVLFKPVRIAELNQFVTQALLREANTFLFQHSAPWPTTTVNQSGPRYHPSGDQEEQSGILQQRIIQGYPIVLDCLKQVITLDGHPTRQLELTSGETVILASLMLHPDQVLSCSDLVRIAWEREISDLEAQSIVRPYISRLRNKLRQLIVKPRLIRTVRSKGYHFVPARMMGAVVWAE